MSIAADIELTLQKIQTDTQRIGDPVAKSVLTMLLNLIEAVAAENEQLKEDKQKLQDELNRLKGEQGKPEFNPSLTPPPPTSVQNTVQTRICSSKTIKNPFVVP